MIKPRYIQIIEGKAHINHDDLPSSLADDMMIQRAKGDSHGARRLFIDWLFENSPEDYELAKQNMIDGSNLKEKKEKW